MLSKPFTLQHALKLGIVVSIAIFIEHKFSFSQAGWVVIAAFLVGQTTRGTPLRQMGIFSLNIVIAVCISSFLLVYLKNQHLLLTILAILFIFNGSLLFFMRPPLNKEIYLILLFYLVFMFMILSPMTSTTLLRDRLIDVMMGTFISFVCGLILFPVPIIEEFNTGIVGVLHALSNYSQGVMENISQQDTAKLIQKKNLVAVALQTPQDLYPEWVYEVGFNPGLRAGLRFFLIHLENAVEVFFSMHYLFLRQIDITLLQELSIAILPTMQKSHELLEILVQYFQYKKLKPFTSDFTSDMTELENALHHIVPNNLALLDISSDYLMLTALVRNMRDLRQLLLKLVTALPALTPSSAI